MQLVADTAAYSNQAMVRLLVRQLADVMPRRKHVLPLLKLLSILERREDNRLCIGTEGGVGLVLQVQHTQYVYAAYSHLPLTNTANRPCKSTKPLATCFVPG